jgi:hypothetical protein
VLAVDIGDIGDLDHLVAHPGLLKRLDRAEELVAGASSLDITSAAGTRLRANVTGADLRIDGGIVTAAGTLAHWPAGAVWIQPRQSSITGTVVAMPGDIIHDAHHLIRSPIRLEVSAGRINEVHGDNADADILRALLESLDDDTSHDITELGWGMNLTRGLARIRPFEAERTGPGRGPLAAGQINLRTGDGADATDGVTLSLSNATLALDELEIIVDGTLDGPLAPDIYERAAGS